MPSDRVTDPGTSGDAGIFEREQTLADSDQTRADFDQTASDIEQSASDRDQRASDRDQEAADRDQARAGAPGANDRGPDWGDTRRLRSQTKLDRAISSEARNRASTARMSSADARDQDAAVRDAAADARDALAATLDAQMAALERPDIADDRSKLVSHALRAGRLAAQARERSARFRDAAARDRAAARADRIQAAEDRRALGAELDAEGLDHLTGALRRRRGLDALEHELERTRRTGDTLTVAFVDIDGLKRVNDEQGHAAGDAVLRVAVESLSRLLRPYDSVMRFGGDEFVCVLSGDRLSHLRERFEEVAAEMAKRCEGTSITVGFAEAIDGETPQDLIVRADQAMLAVRAARRGA